LSGAVQAVGNERGIPLYERALRGSVQGAAQAAGVLLLSAVREELPRLWYPHLMAIGRSGREAVLLPWHYPAAVVLTHGWHYPAPPQEEPFATMGRGSIGERLIVDTSMRRVDRALVDELQFLSRDLPFRELSCIWGSAAHREVYDELASLAGLYSMAMRCGAPLIWD